MDRESNAVTPLTQKDQVMPFQPIAGGIRRAQSMKLVASVKKEKDNWAKPPTMFIPCLCVYHLLIIGIVFAAYIWLDTIGTSVKMKDNYEYNNLQQIVTDW